jgi:hypothetical protein
MKKSPNILCIFFSRSMEGVKVYELLLPKLKKQFFNTKRKDPRLSAKEIENVVYFTDSDSSFS